jgi:hypothetical protein
MDKIDSLILQIQRGHGDGEAVNLLLNEFYHEPDLEKLLRLLNSPKEKIVEAGMWVVSELGARCVPIEKNIQSFLVHPSKRVRFFAIDSLLTSSIDPQATAKVLDLLHDLEEAVRWKAIDYAVRVKTELLASAITFWNENERNKNLLLKICRKELDLPAAKTLLVSDSSLERKLGIIAAVRLDYLGLLKEAVRNNDSDIRSFAKSVDRENRHSKMSLDAYMAARA